MKSEIGIDVDADPGVVFALARDVERWSILLPHYARSRVIARHPDGDVIVDFVARRSLVRLFGLGVPVAWRSRVSNDPAARGLSFVHVAGPTAGMHVRWRIEPRDQAGCRVTITHDFAPRVPGFAAFVDRVFTRPIAGRTLASFKALAEAVDDIATSDGPRPTNPSA